MSSQIKKQITETTQRPHLKDMVAEIQNAPWIAQQAAKALLLRPLYTLLLKLKGVSLGKNVLFYGQPTIQKYKGSTITIGNNFENRNYLAANAAGCSHPLIISTRTPHATITIGDNVGITGGVISAATRIQIGNNCLIGSDVMITDTDFHPINPNNRRYNRTNIKTAPVTIGNNVFIGARSIILKGVTIGDNSVIGAGSVVTKSVEPNVIAAGNPAKIITDL